MLCIAKKTARLSVYFDSRTRGSNRSGFFQKLANTKSPFRGLAQIIAVLISLVSGCDETKKPDATISVAGALGGVAAEGFKTADKVISFQFPEDHGTHPEYRNEWWYFTGNLANEQGQRYGYQLTFFRIGLLPPSKHIQQDSHWSHRDIWMAHAALTDDSNNRHYHDEKFSRGNPGMAGARIEPFKVWLDNWQFEALGDPFPWHIDVETNEFSLQFDLTASKPMVLQGNHGLSQKSPNPGNASYYYSYPRLQTTGNIQVGDEHYLVTGLSWFDREWSTSALDEDQIGWDWFSLQLDDGNDLMYYQLRNRQGQPHASSQGKWISANGNTNTIKPEDIDLQVQRYWQDNNGINYPVEWRLHYKIQNRTWIVRALVDEQLMKTSVTYWEGAVEVIDGDGKLLLGRGYLEMTGY